MDSSPAPARPPRIPTASYLRRALPDAGSATQSTISPLLAGLNPAQREAVSTPAEVVQILAPPGSGKTRTLTSRVAYLLTESPLQLEPENVIVATFTVKAANEMKERLAVLVGEETARRLVMGTFHSIARRYLLKYGNKIGLKNGWGIADTTDSKAICTVSLGFSQSYYVPAHRRSSTDLSLAIESHQQTQFEGYRRRKEARRSHLLF